MLTGPSAVGRGRRAALAVGACLAAGLFLPVGSADAACAAGEPGWDGLSEAAAAKTVFIGTARPGDTLQGGDTLVTPAIFDVQYRLGGRRTGATEQVATEAISTTGMVSEGIGPAAGEQWLIAGSPTTKHPVIPAACSWLDRKVDTAKAPTLTVNGKTLTAVLSDLRGRPVIPGAAAPVLPRRTTSLPLPGADAARLVHAGRLTKLKERKGSWRLTGVRRGDRIIWLDANGIWGVRAG